MRVTVSARVRPVRAGRVAVNIPGFSAPNVPPPPPSEWTWVQRNRAPVNHGGTLDTSKTLVYYNTDVAWSEDVADYWIAARCPGAEKIGLPLGLADNYFGGATNQEIYDEIIEPVGAAIEAVGARSVVGSAGTPTTVDMRAAPDDPTRPGGVYNICLPNLLAASRFIRARGDAVRPTSPFGMLEWAAGAPGFLFEDLNERTNSLGSYTKLYRPAEGVTNGPLVQDPYNIAGVLTDAFTNPLFCAAGRIGRPRFKNNAAIPAETEASAKAVIDQAVANERSWAQVVADGLVFHIGVFTRVAGTMTDAEGAAIVDWLREHGATVRYYTRGTQSAFAAAYAPTAGQDYSHASLLSGGVVGQTAYCTTGYAIDNTVFSDAALAGAWTHHPGAWGYEGTSFSWNHVARVQMGGGVGGLAHMDEPLAADANDIFGFLFALAHGMTMAEAHFRQQHYFPWMSCIVGDPFYRPFGGGVLRTSEGQMITTDANEPIEVV